MVKELVERLVSIELIQHKYLQHFFKYQDCLPFRPCAGLFSFGSDQNGAGGAAAAWEAKKRDAEFC